MKAKKFEYVKGAAKTTIPWFRPDPELLNAWKEDFYKIVGVEKYDYWVAGMVLEEIKTWDTDIIAVGTLSSYSEIENILVTATQLGFKHRQLIDINWNSSYKKYIEKGACSFRSICCEHYYKHDWCNLELCLKPSHVTESLTITDEIIKNGKSMGKNPNVKQRVGRSLWKRNVSYPGEKQAARIRSGVTYKHSPVLITKGLDFKDIVGWS